MSALYAKISTDWKENFLLYAASVIIVSTCLGGITVLSIFQNGSGLLQMAQLFVVVVLCNAVLASILTVQKPEIVLKASIASLSICSLLAAINFIF
ncbi:hypothetical protein [uncultured Dokdonia sp.]|uniref:hypothetical protein n=1 Tax=uncultured Dokdonia sp. TaxID=575653 RepID=UPI002617AD20|nr:hypothetical protein [uncultured Dokdonia sp.]